MRGKPRKTAWQKERQPNLIRDADRLTETVK